MRPSDEHQHRSKRPNLFSSSRGKGGADDNILARLERMPAETTTTPAPRSRLLLLGAAGLLIAGLIAALATLTRDNVNTPRRMQVSAPTVAASPAAPSPAPATILDEAPATPNPRDVALVISEPVTVLASRDTRASTTERPDERIPRAQPARPPASDPRAQQRTPDRTQDRTQEQAQAKASAAAKPTSPKQPRRPAPAASDDPDVAILTAILSQAPRHAAPKPAEPECGGARGKPCPSSQF